MLFAATVPMSAGQLYSVAFKTNNPAGNSPLMSGPEAAETAANPAFGAPTHGTTFSVPGRWRPIRAGAIWWIAQAR